jgi:hypothetical protein
MKRKSIKPTPQLIELPIKLSLEQISHIILALDHSNRTRDCDDIDLQNAIIAKLGVALAINVDLYGE